jgi:hypothetical protein
MPSPRELAVLNPQRVDQSCAAVTINTYNAFLARDAQGFIRCLREGRERASRVNSSFIIVIYTAAYRMRTFCRALVLAVVSILAVVSATGQTPITTAFSYRGNLADAGVQATGTYDIRFRLYDAATDGTQVGGILCSDNIEVVGGRFSILLDFGAVFTGQRRFLAAEVRLDSGLGCGDSTGYTLLSPRQEITASPNATFAVLATHATMLDGEASDFYRNAANLTGTLPPVGLSGSYTNSLTFSNPANIFAGNGAAITSLSATNISSGVLAAARMPTNWAAGGDLTGFYPNPTIAAGVVTRSRLSPDIDTILNQWTAIPAQPGASTLIGWGNNDLGQTDVPVPPAGTSYTYVSAGQNFTVAVRSDGQAVAWGLNNFGEATVPALPPGLTYTRVAAGSSHALGIRSNGTMIGWGFNGGDQASPPGLPAGVTYTDVSAGLSHSVALRSNGTIVVWGSNTSGLFTVPALPSGVVYTRVVAGSNFNLALRSNGTAVGWGNNLDGQTNIPALPPGTTYVALAAGFAHSLALRSDGVVVGWGNAFDGRLDIPALPPGLTYTGVAAGFQHGLALRSDGTIVAWGRNFENQTTVPALPPGNTYTSVFAGRVFSLAFRGTPPTSPRLSSTLGISIGTAGAPPAGGLQVSGASTFGSSVTAASFAGSGASLTDLNAANISSGTLNIARLPTNVVRNDVSNTFTSSANSFSGSLGVGISVPTNTLDVNGRLTLRNGVIQTSTTPITNTSDLGLYSASGLMRFVTNNAQFAWYSDGGPSGGAAGAGTTPRMTLSPTGNLAVTGSLSKGGGSFKIDHPLDPQNKFLYHSFVESPDMMNVYNGVVTTDSNGLAIVTLPDYFDALNRDFRYQLTVLDDSENDFILAKVYRKIGVDGPLMFTIKSSLPSVEVSWQVTGIRKDAWAEKNRIPNSVDKPAAEKGKLLHPEAFNAPAQNGIFRATTGKPD